MTIPRITLDPRDDEGLLLQCYNRVYNASDGRISDFRQGSTVAALMEGFVHAEAYLLWYLNLLPDALAIEVMRQATGIDRDFGQPARGEVHFLLAETQATPFVIDTSVTIPYMDAYFTLESPVTILPGAYEGVGTVVCSKVGSKYNAPAFSLGLPNVGLNNLSNVYNPEALAGGTDLEPVEVTLERMQTQLRTRDTLISAEDYEREAIALMGGSGRALAVPLLTSDRVETATGHVHVFVLDPQYKQPSTAYTSYLKGELAQKAFIASDTWVSPADIYPLDIDLVITTTTVSQELANVIWQALDNLYSPKFYQFGRSLSIQDAIFTIRQADSRVTQVFSALINGSSLDLELPYKWTLPLVKIATLTLTNGSDTGTYYFGNEFGEPEGTGLDE